MQPLNKFQPVSLRILGVDDSEFAISVGSELRFGDESYPAALQFRMGLPQILHIKTDMAGAELMFVQITLTGRWIDEMNQFNLMVSRKAHKDQLPTRPGNAGVVPLRRGDGVDPTQYLQSENLGVKANHSLQVLDHDAGMVKTLNQTNLLRGAVDP